MGRFLFALFAPSNSLLLLLGLGLLLATLGRRRVGLGLAGTAFLVDAQGWLRAVRRPAGRPAWSDPARLVTELRDICTQPLTQPSGVPHAHTH